MMALISSVASFVSPAWRADAAPVRVVVWDEQQPAQKQAYTNFIGNQTEGIIENAVEWLGSKQP
ncbi:MAG: hypothetical protein ABI651_05325 [Verrucomicrobiota bacterium]